MDTSLNNTSRFRQGAVQATRGVTSSAGSTLQLTKPSRWDLYQCKRYGAKLTPNVILWWNSASSVTTPTKGDYTVPQGYYIVSPLGVGNALQDLIDDPTAMKTKLIEKWDDWCRDKITKKEEGAAPMEPR